MCQVQAGIMGYWGQKKTHERRHFSERTLEEGKQEKKKKTLNILALN